MDPKVEATLQLAEEINRTGDEGETFDIPSADMSLHSIAESLKRIADALEPPQAIVLPAAADLSADDLERLRRMLGLHPTHLGPV